MTPGGQPARLVALRWRPFRLPLRHRFESAHAIVEARSGVLIELRGADGTTGIGEASPTPSLGDGTVADVLRLLGEHASAILSAPKDVLRTLAQGPGAAALRCALDTALLDLEGQRRGVPVARLLAEQPAASVEVNAVVGGGTDVEAVAFAREAVAAGYRVLKLKVGSWNLDADVARVEAVRRACPEVTIRLDANGAWTEAKARVALETMAPLRIELIEQPVRTSAVRALGRLRRMRLMRVAADEAVADPLTVARVFEADAVDLVVLKPMRLGGLRASIEVAHRAAERGMASFVTTTFDSSIGTAAALHLAAALPGGRPADGLSTGEHLADDLVMQPLVPERGRRAVPSTPGLGVTVDGAAVERLATGPWAEVEARRR